MYVILAYFIVMFLFTLMLKLEGMYTLCHLNATLLNLHVLFRYSA
jgi:hypothetical protein